MEEKVLIPYAPILVESTRSIGYSFEAALADIIDNSIGKGAKEVKVDFSSLNNMFLSVSDDACGMTESELELAMRYGSQSSLDVRDSADLGRFGLGLKMASMSQCRRLTVVSKRFGEVAAARWDLDYIIEKQDWVLLKLNEEEMHTIKNISYLDGKESGTIVIWEKFDRIANGSSNPNKTFDEKIEIARDHIALVFHRFLNDEIVSKKVKVYFNNDKVEPVDPFLTTHPATQPLSESVINIDGEKILVKPFILPYASKLTEKDKKQVGGVDNLRSNQGFYVYRNRRLIIHGTWFRLIKQYELNKLTRIRVDIPNTLDSIWEIDVKKSSASLPDIIKKHLISIVDNSVGRSERVYKYRGRQVANDELKHVWNKVDNRGTFQYLVNRDLPLYKLLEESIDEKSIGYLDLLIKMIEDAFPYDAVYYDLAKKESVPQDTSVETADVWNIAESMINQIRIIGGDVKTFVNNLDTYDFFIKYPEIVKEIKEKYNHD